MKKKWLAIPVAALLGWLAFDANRYTSPIIPKKEISIEQRLDIEITILPMSYQLYPVQDQSYSAFHNFYLE